MAQFRKCWNLSTNRSEKNKQKRKASETQGILFNRGTLRSNRPCTQGYIGPPWHSFSSRNQSWRSWFPTQGNHNRQPSSPGCRKQDVHSFTVTAFVRRFINKRECPSWINAFFVMKGGRQTGGQSSWGSRPTWARPPVQQNKAKINNAGQMKGKRQRAIRTIIEWTKQAEPVLCKRVRE